MFMSLSFLKRFEIGEAKPTIVTPQLADRTFKHPRGVIEDVLFKVGKFIFSTDFMKLDMEKDEEILVSGQNLQTPKRSH